MTFSNSSLMKLYAKGYVFLRKQDTQGKCGRINYNIKQTKEFGAWTLFKKYDNPEARDGGFANFMHDRTFYLTDDEDKWNALIIKKMRDADFTIIVVKPNCLHMTSANLFHSIHYFKTNAARNRYIKSKEQEENIIVIQ